MAFENKRDTFEEHQSAHDWYGALLKYFDFEEFRICVSKFPAFCNDAHFPLNFIHCFQITANVICNHFKTKAKKF